MKGNVGVVLILAGGVDSCSHSRFVAMFCHSFIILVICDGNSLPYLTKTSPLSTASGRMRLGEQKAQQKAANKSLTKPKCRQITCSAALARKCLFNGCLCLCLDDVRASQVHCFAAVCLPDVGLTDRGNLGGICIVQCYCVAGQPSRCLYLRPYMPIALWEHHSSLVVAVLL